MHPNTGQMQGVGRQGWEGRRVSIWVGSVLVLVYTLCALPWGNRPRRRCSTFHQETWQR